MNHRKNVIPLERQLPCHFLIHQQFEPNAQHQGQVMLIIQRFYQARRRLKNHHHHRVKGFYLQVYMTKWS